MTNFRFDPGSRTDLRGPFHLRRATLFVAGYPGELGGANSECWHTVKLWRRFGLEVTLIPTWDAPPDDWRKRLDEIGTRTVLASPESLASVPGLAGAVVVSFCNARFLAAADRFRRLGCRIVWLGCMNWMFPAERLHYRRHGTLDAYVFQSRYQRDQLEPQLRKFGYRGQQGHTIRGAFSREDFPLRPLPHRHGQTLVIGRLSRPAADKYHPDTWSIYGRILHPLRARVMGWDTHIEARLGPPPRWAEVLAPGALPVREFLGSLHALVPIAGGAVENWPRVGLEAMSVGVPVVAERQGGWPEMIRHGATGWLADSPDQIAYYASRLAYDEPLRQETAYQARRALEEELADPETIWAGWCRLFEQVM